MKTTAELFVRCLEQERVEFVFGLPGEENLTFLDALSRSRIRFIQVRHEQGAAFMADVYGRLTGKAGVCASTLGPGATNLLTGVADAFLDRSPVVAITAQAGMETFHKESHQAIDVLAMFRSVTKWNASIRHPSVVPEVVRKAFKISQTEKPGPCQIELPDDVASSEAEGEPLIPMRTRRPSPDRPSLLKAAELIEQSVHPIILAGNGVIRGGASEELLRFSEAAGIPVANTFMGKGIVPWDYELSLLTIGLQAHDTVNCGFDRADLVITVGYDFVEYAPHFWNPERNKKIIHIDFTPGEVDAAYPLSVEIVADIRETLELLRPLIRSPKSSVLPKTLREYILKDLDGSTHANAFPLKPQKILHDLHSVLRPKDLLISDVGAHKLWIARMYMASQPNTVIISNGLASMGIALPGAIAAQLIDPDRRVVAVCGDGGFLMNSQELETAVRLKLHPVILIFDDCGFGVIRWKQEAKFGRSFGVSFGNPDWIKFAEAYGAKGYRVEAASDLKKIIQEAFRQKVPSLIDVPVDYQEQGHLIEQLGHLVCPL